MSQLLPLLPIRKTPFTHVEADGWLEPELYRALAESFPKCPPASGPTGFTVFRGDPAYEALMRTVPAWATLHARFHSQAFVDYCLGQFKETFAASMVDLSAAHFVDYEESREDKARRQIRVVKHAPDALFTRVDIMQGRIGYRRVPHLDHRRRAISLLLYFCDGDEAGMTGGELVLHGAKGVEKIVRPRHNRMVAFPCDAGSMHSVRRISAQEGLRNFVQVTLSSSVDLWPAEQPGALFGRVSGLARRLGARMRG